MKKTSDLVNGHKKIIVLGELGSGKSELAINLALKLREENPGTVCFFDMDQTKPLLRSRDVRDFILEHGIVFNIEKQFMDAPTVPAGVKENLADNSTWTVMDVGGSEHGAFCMGQFSEAVTAADSIVLYIINPYRSFSDSCERIAETMIMLCNCSGFYKLDIVCNPYFGTESTAEDIINGKRRLDELLEPLGLSVRFTMIPDNLWEQTSPAISGDKIGISSYLKHITG